MSDASTIAVPPPVDPIVISEATINRVLRGLTSEFGREIDKGLFVGILWVSVQTLHFKGVPRDLVHLLIDDAIRAYEEAEVKAKET